MFHSLWSDFEKEREKKNPLVSENGEKEQKIKSLIFHSVWSDFEKERKKNRKK